MADLNPGDKLLITDYADLQKRLCDPGYYPTGEENREAADAIAALVAERDRLQGENAALQAKLERVRELHEPYGIYSECDHDHDGIDGPNVVMVEDIGYTCAKLYDTCSACCRSNYDGQSLYCAESHDHGPDKPRCSTIAILDERNDVAAAVEPRSGVGNLSPAEAAIKPGPSSAEPSEEQLATDADLAGRLLRNYHPGHRPFGYCSVERPMPELCHGCRLEELCAKVAALSTAPQAKPSKVECCYDSHDVGDKCPVTGQEGML